MDAALRARLEERARFIRLETVRLIGIAKTGHYTSTFSAAELFSVLYYHTLRLEPGRPDWPDRDRFILSKGHAMVGLYPVLADLGYFDPALLDEYTRLGSPLADHADMTQVPGVDFSNGSLGHGLAAAVGMALAARIDGHDRRVFCMTGDGEMNEGQIWEAAMCASHYGLGNLVLIVDNNRMMLDGYTDEVMTIEPLNKKLEAFGFDVHVIDGHNLEHIVATFDALPPPSHHRPTAIIANTVKGKGIGYMEFGREWHVGHLAGVDYDNAVRELRGEIRTPRPVGAREE